MWFSWQYIDVFCFAFKVTRWNQIHFLFVSLTKSPDGTRLILFFIHFHSHQMEPDSFCLFIHFQSHQMEPD